VARAAGFPALRFHDLRHRSASLAVAGGVDIRALSGRLGHADTATTLRVYAHFFKAVDQAAAEVLNAALLPAATQDREAS
jgi:integrase